MLKLKLVFNVILFLLNFHYYLTHKAFCKFRLMTMYHFDELLEIQGGH